MMTTEHLDTATLFGQALYLWNKPTGTRRLFEIVDRPGVAQLVVLAAPGEIAPDDVFVLIRSDDARFGVKDALAAPPVYDAAGDSTTFTLSDIADSSDLVGARLRPNSAFNETFAIEATGFDATLGRATVTVRGNVAGLVTNPEHPVFVYARQLPLSPISFAGYYHDSETGLNYAWNRFQSPDTGRWLTRDPLDYPGGMNSYAYVGNSPIDTADPLGLVDPTRFGSIMTPDGSLHGGPIDEGPGRRRSQGPPEPKAPDSDTKVFIQATESSLDPVGAWLLFKRTVDRDWEASSSAMDFHNILVARYMDCVKEQFSIWKERWWEKYPLSEDWALGNPEMHRRCCIRYLEIDGHGYSKVGGREDITKLPESALAHLRQVMCNGATIKSYQCGAGDPQALANGWQRDLVAILLGRRGGTFIGYEGDTRTGVPPKEDDKQWRRYHVKPSGTDRKTVTIEAER